MKNTIIILSIILLAFAFAISCISKSSEDTVYTPGIKSSTEVNSDSEGGITNKVSSSNQIEYKKPIVVSSNEKSNLEINQPYLHKEAKKNLGKYIKTLIVIDKNTQIDLYILNAPNRDDKIVFTKETGYPTNISQIVFNKRDRKDIVWTEFFILPNNDGKMLMLNNEGKWYTKSNMDIVPIHDVIYNPDFNQIKILYDIGSVLSTSKIDLDTGKITDYTFIYTMWWVPFVPNTGIMKTADFITSDIVRVTNTANGIYQIKLLDELPKNKWKNFDLLWWNEKDSDFAIENYDKSPFYYKGGDEPTYDESEWNDWYQMGYDYSSGKKVKLDN